MAFIIYINSYLFIKLVNFCEVSQLFNDVLIKKKCVYLIDINHKILLVRAGGGG